MCSEPGVWLAYTHCMRLPFIMAAVTCCLGACTAPPEPGITVDQTRTHDQTAFTQGLEFAKDRLFESRGLYEESAITELDPMTGEVIKRVDLPKEEFAEGLTVVDDEIVQLTWKAGKAYRWSLDLEPKGEYTYAGEGWGLCWDGQRFVMSDGTDTLTFRDRNFAPTGSVSVTKDGQPLPQLNELECANGQVYANVWHTNDIVRINPASGEVTSTLNLTPWVPEGLGPEQVLNGVAIQPNGNWLITGKQWPVMLDAKVVEPN